MKSGISGIPEAQPCPSLSSYDKPWPPLTGAALRRHKQLAPFSDLCAQAAQLWPLPDEGHPVGLVSLGSRYPLARLGRSQQGHLDGMVYPPSPWRPVL